MFNVMEWILYGRPSVMKLNVTATPSHATHRVFAAEGCELAGLAKHATVDLILASGELDGISAFPDQTCVRSHARCHAVKA